MKISAVVLTKNEEKNIERCLKSLDFCDEIIIIDDYSEDGTIDKMRNAKINPPASGQNNNDNVKLKIFKRKLNDNFSEQRNFGLEKASNEWVLFLDADEEISKELKEEILNLENKKLLDSCFRRNDNKEDRINNSGEKWSKNKKNTNDNIVAFYIKRRDYFWGREVKYGEVKKIREKGLLRLIRKNSGKWVGKVHEKYQILIRRLADKYQILTLKNFINHYPHQNLKEFIQDINYYSSLRAKELFNQGKKTNIFQIVFYPLAKFILTYFIYLGFLDGPAGFVYSFMMSFHSFLVRAKLYQLTNIEK